MTKERPRGSEILEALGESMAEALGTPASELELVPMDSASPRADGAAAFRVVDLAGRSIAVLQCSAPDFPDMVARATNCAAAAKRALAAAEAAAILDPLLEAQVDGMSCVLHSYCQRLSDQRLLWFAQRALLRPRLLKWLLLVAAQTSVEVTPAERSSGFAEPLMRIAGESSLNPALRNHARNAIRRLTDGSWRPRFTQMHGDMWKGNVLVAPRSSPSDRRGWKDRFVVIDWPGSLLRGYAIYDLVRLAGSLKLSAAALNFEIRKHCDLLDGDAEDADAYLLSGLGHAALQLQEFPMDQFSAMANSCYDTLRRSLSTQ